MSNIVDIIIRAKSDVQSGFARASATVKKFAAENGKSLREVGAAVKHIGVAIAAMGTAVVAAVGVTVKAWAEQEAATNKVAAAIRANGGDVDTLVPKYVALAAAIQDQTGAADESTLALMAQIRNLGVSDEKMEEATKGALGLANALGVDQASAARYAALALNGEFTTLQRYIPALRTATSDGEKMAIVQDLMAKGYQQEIEKLDTVAGRYKEIKGRIGDFLEQIGRAITGSSEMGGVMKTLSEKIKAATDRFSEFLDTGGINLMTAAVKTFGMEAINRFQDVGVTYGGVVKYIWDSSTSTFKYVGNIIGALVNAAVAQFTYLGDVAGEVWAKIKSPLSHDFTMPSAEEAKSAAAVARGAFTDASPFMKADRTMYDMVDSIEKRESKLQADLKKIQAEYAEAEKKRIDEAGKHKAAVDALAGTDAAAVVAEEEGALSQENVEVERDAELEKADDVSATERGLGLENVEAIKEAELEAVRVVEGERARLRAEADDVSADPSDRNYNLTGIIQARDMAEATAEAMADMMREVLTETNQPIIERLDRIADSTGKISDTIKDAITMS